MSSASEEDAGDRPKSQCGVKPTTSRAASHAYGPLHANIQPRIVWYAQFVVFIGSSPRDRNRIPSNIGQVREWGIAPGVRVTAWHRALAQNERTETMIVLKFLDWRLPDSTVSRRMTSIMTTQLWAKITTMRRRWPLQTSTPKGHSPLETAELMTEQEYSTAIENTCGKSNILV